MIRPHLAENPGKKGKKKRKKNEGKKEATTFRKQITRQRREYASGPTLKKIGQKMTHAKSLVRTGGGGDDVYQAMIATEPHDDDDFTAIHRKV